jgi:hypothetical protein
VTPGLPGVMPLGGKVAIGGTPPPGLPGVIPLGGRVGTPGVMPLGGKVGMPGVMPLGGTVPGNVVGGWKSGNRFPIGGLVTPPGRPPGWVMFGGILKPPFWFWVSIKQGLGSLVSKSLWVPPLPLDTNGEIEICRPRRSLVHSSTVVFPCAASSRNAPGLVADSHTELAESVVVPTKIKPPFDLQLSASAGTGTPAMMSIMKARLTIIRRWTRAGGNEASGL